MPEPWCEMSMIPFDARAANDGDFSSPFIQIEYTLLVPSGSLIRSVADADRTGVNIAVVRNHASTVTLSRILKQAKLVYAETPDPIFDLLRTGHADAMASARSTLLEYSAQLPGSRVLEDHYGAKVNRVVIPKGNVGRLAMSTSLSRRPRPPAWCRRHRSRRPARGSGGPAGRSHRPVVSVSWERNQGSLKGHGTNQSRAWLSLLTRCSRDRFAAPLRAPLTATL